MFKNSKIKI